MSRFLNHTSCNKCGSSDANAVYEDGSQYCFSCGHYISGKFTPKLLEEKQKEYVGLPDGITQEYTKEALEWVGKYDLSAIDLLQSNVPIWSYPVRNQLIFSFGDGYQARNLGPVEKKRRYFTKGDLSSILPIFNPNGSIHQRLVLVEDCLSALKIVSPKTGLQTHAMPCLGSDISNIKLSRLRLFYDVLDVFLDPNMYHHAQNIAKRASLLGFKTRVIQSDRDPKEHSYQELHTLLTS